MTPDYDYLFRLLLVGDSSVGKTSLMNRYVDNCFSLDSVLSTGIDFKIGNRQLDGKLTKLQIWDMHPMMRFSYSSSYRGAHGYVLVYDVTSMESFEGMKRWIADLDRIGLGGVCKVICGNKLDLAPSSPFPEGLPAFIKHPDSTSYFSLLPADLRTSLKPLLSDGKAVRTEVARAYADSLGIPFFETSAKDNVNVEAAFLKLAQNIKAQLPPRPPTPPPPPTSSCSLS